MLSGESLLLETTLYLFSIKFSTVSEVKLTTYRWMWLIPRDTCRKAPADITTKGFCMRGQKQKATGCWEDMEKEILMPHGSLLCCGKSIDLAPNGEQKKPWVLQGGRSFCRALGGRQGNVSSTWIRKADLIWAGGSGLAGILAPRACQWGEGKTWPTCSYYTQRMVGFVCSLFTQRHLIDAVPLLNFLRSKDKNPSLFFHHSFVCRSCQWKHLCAGSAVRSLDHS